MDSILRQKCKMLFRSHARDPAQFEQPAPVALGWKLEQAAVSLAEVAEMYERAGSGDWTFGLGSLAPRVSKPLSAMLIEYREVLREERGEFDRPQPAQIDPVASA